jgi:hypothetical protein
MHFTELEIVFCFGSDNWSHAERFAELYRPYVAGVEITRCGGGFFIQVKRTSQEGDRSVGERALLFWLTQAVPMMQDIAARCDVDYAGAIVTGPTLSEQLIKQAQALPSNLGLVLVIGRPPGRRQTPIRPFSLRTDAGIETGWSTEDIVGRLPNFLDVDDLRPAREQFSRNHDEWTPISGFTKSADHTLRYKSNPGAPNDQPMKPFAKMYLRDELILVYLYGMVCIVQKDGSFEVDRMD